MKTTCPICGYEYVTTKNEAACSMACRYELRKREEDA